MLDAYGLYAEIFCMVSWYFPTRSMNAANATLSRKRVGHRRPVRAGEQVDHLVPVAQLLGHHAERPRVVLRLLRAR